MDLSTAFSQHQYRFIIKKDYRRRIQEPEYPTEFCATGEAARYRQCGLGVSPSRATDVSVALAIAQR